MKNQNNAIKNEYYICDGAKKYISVSKKKTLHGQLTPPSLGGPIRRRTTPYKNDETC